jgi:hypothetical protein
VIITLPVSGVASGTGANPGELLHQAGQHVERARRRASADASRATAVHVDQRTGELARVHENPATSVGSQQPIRVRFHSCCQLLYSRFERTRAVPRP